MLSAVTIRWADLSDAPAIAEIHVRAWQVAYLGLLPDSLLDSLSVAERLPRWQERLAEPTQRILVAEVDGQLVGWLLMGPQRDADLDARRVGEVYGIYLHPDVWRRGYGAALMARAAAELRGQGCVEMTLWVLRDNQPAIRFYESQGFWADGGAKVDVRPDGVQLDEVRMRCSLQPSEER